jgi:hypothetical protein
MDFKAGNFAQAIYKLSMQTGYPVGVDETLSPAGYDLQSQ